MSTQKDLSCSIVGNQMSTPVVAMNTKESLDSKIIINIGSMINVEIF